jgi:propionyl-CoA carboxylase beta chain
MVRELLSFMPSNNLDDPPRKPCTDPIDQSRSRFGQNRSRPIESPYDIKDVIHAVVDDGYFFEVQEHYAKNIVVGFARLNGKPVGSSPTSPRF